MNSVVGSALWATIATVAVTVALALVLGASPAEVMVWALGVAVLARFIVVPVDFAIAYWPRAKRPPSLGFLGLLRVMGREVWALARLTFFYFPFKAWLGHPGPVGAAMGRIPLVLVHGFYANSGFWEPLRIHLHAVGWHQLFSLDLEPPSAGIDDYARQLEDRIEAVCVACGCDSVVVIAHSMGGLVARASARRVAGRIRHLICLGTPHHGTVLASLVPVKTTRQMRPGSDWLRNLNAVGGDRLAITNLYSEHDNIVVPQASAALAGAENLPLPGIGHLEMAFSSVLRDRLIQVLARFERESPG